MSRASEAAEGDEVIVFNELIGKKFSSVINDSGAELLFNGNDGNYKFYHEQDCCESVWIEDICGDLSDLVNEPLNIAEQVSCENKEVGNCESQTWTFYKFGTIKGSVTVRWCGESNGYYSESVDFKEIKNPYKLKQTF